MFAQEECNTEACGFDGGDCAGTCAPGCVEAWRGDKVCDDECNTGTCAWDGGDCLREGRPVRRARCAWGCPSSWLADGQCDLGCNVTACGYDKGDCVAAWKHNGRRHGARGGSAAADPSASAAVHASGAAGAAPLYAPTKAVVEMRTELPALGVSVSTTADISGLDLRHAAGALGIGAVALCCGGVLCGMLCWAVISNLRRHSQQQRQPRYRMVQQMAPVDM